MPSTCTRQLFAGLARVMLCSLMRGPNFARRARHTLLVASMAVSGCASVDPRPGDRLIRRGDEIVVCGQLYHTGAPVVLWMDPGGYDAYRVENRFGESADEAASTTSSPVVVLPASSTSAPATQAASRPVEGARYGSFRKQLSEGAQREVREQGWTLDALRRYVDLFVLHYDACGTSRRCFEVLHDRRGLSVHFMLDVDGTIYQTLDVKERAWHAGDANDRSVGVEIAGIGAYPPGDGTLDKWYAKDARDRPVLRLPAAMAANSGIRTAGFEARPARDERIEGRIHGRPLEQFDFTEAQYRSLEKLAAALCRIFPRIEARMPRLADGSVAQRKLSDSELAAFRGILGHFHLTEAKIDPGPALNWQRLEAGLKRLRD